MASGSSLVVRTAPAEALIASILQNTSSAAQSVFMRKFASPYLAKQARSNFDNERSPSGSPWAALTDATISWREWYGFPSGPINVRTGRMRDWLIRPAVSTIPTADGVIMRWPDPASAGGDMKHRLAQAAGKYKGPARWVVGYNAQDVAHILAGMQGMVMTGAVSRV